MTAGGSGARRRRTSWWLIVSHGGGFLEVLALGLAGGERAVAVFSFEEEAELFLRLGVSDRSGWVVRETAPGALVSLLSGPLSGAEGVVLDPLPGRLGGSLVGLLSIHRRAFLARLLIDGGSPSP